MNFRYAAAIQAQNTRFGRQLDPKRNLRTS